jgi:hypothetical protein
MPARSAFEYAVLRIVPDIERGEFINAGVVLFCRTRRFLDARVALRSQQLLALAPELDLPPIEGQLLAIPQICRGEPGSGAIGALPQPERFRWIVAPRSTIIQSSAVHCGLSADPAAELVKLFARMVGVE